MNIIVIPGIFGSIAIILGMLYQEQNTNKLPHKSVKNRLFFIGGILMTLYSFLDFFQNKVLFFLVLQLFLLTTCVVMITNINEKKALIINIIALIIFVAWSFLAVNSIITLIFIFGLIIVGMGYTFKFSPTKRDIAFIIGSVLLTIFSVINHNPIYIAINLISAIISFLNLFNIRLQNIFKKL